MNMLDLSDRIEAGSYRSDRFTAVPFTTLQDVMQQAQDALSTDAEDEGRWAGIVTPSCEDHTSWISVQREIGVGLRIGGEANLCFQCGPEGGHYHPSVSMDEARAAASRLAH